MKAEKIKQAEQFLDTYLGGNRNVSTLTWEHWVECLADYADKNARLMIEKDRERVADNLDWGNCYDGGCHCDIDKHRDSIKKLPIQLD